MASVSGFGRPTSIRFWRHLAACWRQTPRSGARRVGDHLCFCRRQRRSHRGSALRRRLMPSLLVVVMVVVVGMRLRAAGEVTPAAVLVKPRLYLCLVCLLFFFFVFIRARCLSERQLLPSSCRRQQQIIETQIMIFSLQFHWISIGARDWINFFSFILLLPFNMGKILNGCNCSKIVKCYALYCA